MIRRIRVENFKSIDKVTLDLGRVTVLIGENGSGKSNLLEAIAFAAAAANDKLDHEFLVSRGIRMTEPRFMRAAFSGSEGDEVLVGLRWQDADNEQQIEYRLHAAADAGLSKWTERWADELPENMSRLEAQLRTLPGGEYLAEAEKGDRATANGKDLVARYAALAAQAAQASSFASSLAAHASGANEQALQAAAQAFAAGAAAFAASAAVQLREHPTSLRRFAIYSPEYASLRTFELEGQIQPIGIRGEGLFSHLKALGASPTHQPVLEQVADRLALIGWFERFEVPRDLAAGQRTILIRDRFLAEGALFDQRSANEGFLFLLLYFTLLLSPDTPSFFAIDNVDASLNPKLCSDLMKEIIALAHGRQKQLILTTHNPALLDGLDLHDEEQRLWVVERGEEGGTRVRRIGPPRPVDGQAPMRLSEAFLRGYIGGLPAGF
jgi:predicted ATPase